MSRSVAPCGMRRTYARGATWLLALGIVLVGCSSAASKPVSTRFCDDLHKGMSSFQVYGDIKSTFGKSYTPKEFADLAFGFAKISCPSELTSNDDLRSYLDAWGINPDA